MKKITVAALVFVLLFAAFPVSASQLPGSKISVSAIKVDYVSALAGIAKPTAQTYAENERFAVLVSVNVPIWCDVTNMKVEARQLGLKLDNGLPERIQSGDFLLYGTLYSQNARLEIIFRDNAISSATTAQALWAAVYGDRTVSAVVEFSPVLTTQAVQQAIQVSPMVGVPATGSASIVACILMCGSVAACIPANALRKRGRNNGI